MVRPNGYRFKHGSSGVFQSVWTSGEALEPSQLDNEPIQDLLNQLWATTPLCPLDNHSTSLTWSILSWFSLLFWLRVLLSMQNEEQRWDRPGNEGTVWLPPIPCDLSVGELPNSDFTLFRPRLTCDVISLTPFLTAARYFPPSHAPLCTATKVMKLAHHCIDLTLSYV